MFHVEHSVLRRPLEGNFPPRLGRQMNEDELKILLQPYLSEVGTVHTSLFSQLSAYLQLLLKWNARTNLTSIREPAEIVRRHFGESLFAAQCLGKCETLLDFGSGAGFPGLPIQLFLPELKVTLAESQNKKATFLREVTRTLQLNTQVWSDRAEAMPEAQRFDVVTLRAVDDMERALEVAAQRTNERIVVLTTIERTMPVPPGFVVCASFSDTEFKRSKNRELRANWRSRRMRDVPRENISHWDRHFFEMFHVEQSAALPSTAMFHVEQSTIQVQFCCK